MAEDCGTAEDCEPTAIANRRLTADWETYFELRTNYPNPVDDLSSQFAISPQSSISPQFGIAVSSQSSEVSSQPAAVSPQFAAVSPQSAVSLPIRSQSAIRSSSWSAALNDEGAFT